MYVYGSFKDGLFGLGMFVLDWASRVSEVAGLKWVYSFFLFFCGCMWSGCAVGFF